LGIQALGLVAIIAWVSFWSILLFTLLNKFHLFRVPKEIEIMGLDIAEMGGVNEEIYGKLRKEFGVASPPATPLQSHLGPSSGKKSLFDEKAKLKLEAAAL